MNKKDLYLDYAASSPLHPEVLRYMTSLYEKNLGNPASIHRAGVMAAVELEKSRNTIAKKLNCSSEEVYFTSGATESNNLALRGLAQSHLLGSRKEILISSIEHSSVKQTAQDLEENFGFKVLTIPVLPSGLINVEELKKMLGQRVLVVSIIHANNEIGSIQNLKEIGLMCKEHGILFHSDGAQAFCKTPVNVVDMNLDLYSISSHKIHGPRGIGAIYIKSGLRVHPQNIGGGQESSMRSGTVPVELISGMSVASELYNSLSLSKLESLKEHFVKILNQKIPDAVIYGSTESSLPNIINFGVPELLGKTALHLLDQRGIRISVGSACHSGKKNPSHVLKAINLNDKEAFEALRISWGIQTETSDLDYFIEQLILVRGLPA